MKGVMDMQLAVVDFETFYGGDYSLSKMSTEDYVTDPRFEVIGVGVKLGDAPTVSFSGTLKETGSWLRGMGVRDCCVIAHNAMFDGLILQHHFGFIPKKLICTMAMARPFLRPFSRSISLDSCAKLLTLPTQKGDTVMKMQGRTRMSLTKQELEEYMSYCRNDCDVERQLFDILVKRFPRQELDIIDMTLRMYLQPRFELDADILAAHLGKVRAEKEQMMAALMMQDVTPKMLRSNNQFAELLARNGVQVPMKFSQTTGERTFALNKSDPGFKQLEEDYADDPFISALLTARIGAKSTIEETRSARLLGIANRHGRLRIPLAYYAAHTGRYGGTEKINAQNFPKITRSQIRYSLKAPTGMVVLAADLSQIEARLNACLSEEWTLVEDFRSGADIYAGFAGRVFRESVVKGRSPKDDKQRFVGKTCILGLGYGMGPDKLKSTLRKDNLKYDVNECQLMVNTYRRMYPNITGLWRRFDRCLPHMSDKGGLSAKQSIGPVLLSRWHVLLPNGMPLVYNNLRMVGDQYEYNYGDEVRTIWGGKMVENVVQALARIIIMDNMLRVEKELGLSPVLQQHDELDYIVPEKNAEDIKKALTEIMVTPPTWMTNLPLAVEVAYGESLGHCK